MPTTRTEEPAVEPFDLAAAKVHLRVDDDAEDDLIELLISTVREACEDRIERTLITTTWVHEADYLCERMRLPMGPVQSIETVQYLDVDGVLQTLADTEWQLASGFLIPAHNKVWPMRLCQPGAARITFTSGFGDDGGAVPRPYIAWMKLALTDLFEHRGASSDRPAVPQNFADALLNNRLSWLP